jgi:DNA phosphorothioation system restriction enzyme
MESLVTLQLSDEYRSSGTRLAVDFFARLLPVAATYDRAVAYFSSSVFFTAAEEFGQFFDGGGMMRLVCSPFLEARDISAIADGIFDRPRVLKDQRRYSELLQAGACGQLVSSLVARGLLRIRVATGTPDKDRLFHEKIGLFRDQEGNILAFSGSANESRSAWLENFERVDLFRSWRPDPERSKVNRLELQFRELWSNDTPSLLVRDVAVALKEGVLKARSDRSDGAISVEPVAKVAWQPEILAPATDVRLFDHQKSAIDAWAAAGGRGVLEMATGSGKTITALTLASRLYDGLGPGLGILIIAPYIHLVDQWCEVASGFGLDPIRCAESVLTWRDELQIGVHALNTGSRYILSVATTPNTLMSPLFQATIQRIRKPFLVIGDEVHTLGTGGTSNALPRGATYRLGLSATPERWRDEVGTERVREYFGPTVFHYGLAKAIEDGILTPYRYYPVPVELREDEIEEYMALTRMLTRYVDSDEDGPVSDAAKMLLIRRARLIASAAEKLPRLADDLQSRRSDTHILVYCGDGQVEGPEPMSTVRQVDEAVRMIGRDLGMTCAKYAAETSPERRKEVLRHFANGDIQVLVAIRCLDEGVDVPATKVAFILASSTNPKQFIQRRGRLLRRSPGKRRAEIYDYFASPSLADVPQESPEYPVARGLLANQMKRAQEFASLAENAPVARLALRDLVNHFNLIDQWS